MVKRKVQTCRMWSRRLTNTKVAIDAVVAGFWREKVTRAYEGNSDDADWTLPRKGERKGNTKEAYGGGPGPEGGSMSPAKRSIPACHSYRRS